MSYKRKTSDTREFTNVYELHVPRLKQLLEQILKAGIELLHSQYKLHSVAGRGAFVFFDTIVFTEYSKNIKGDNVPFNYVSLPMLNQTFTKVCQKLEDRVKNYNPVKQFVVLLCIGNPKDIMTFVSYTLQEKSKTSETLENQETLEKVESLEHFDSEIISFKVGEKDKDVEAVMSLLEKSLKLDNW